MDWFLFICQPLYLTEVESQILTIKTDVEHGKEVELHTYLSGSLLYKCFPRGILWDYTFLIPYPHGISHSELCLHNYVGALRSYE